MKYIVILLFTLIIGCNAGVTSPNLSNSYSNTLGITYLYFFDGSKLGSYYTRIGNQISFSPTSNTSLTQIDVNYYSSSNCSGSPINTTIMGNGSTTIQQLIGGNTYTSTDQSNFELCNVYGGATSGGCSTMATNLTSGTLKSILYTYKFLSGIKATSQCYYNSSLLYEGFGNYSPTISSCILNSSCGLSKPYGSDLITTSNVWTWVSGSSSANQPSVYGTKGTPDSANTAGNRFGSISWVDPSGSLWLFGGSQSSPSGRLNDLWRYDISSNQWTWISGSNSVNQQSIYGSKGVPASTNVPGNRQGAISWVDQAGNLWLFGGISNTISGGIFGRLNDLWKYDISLNQWTWVSGSNLSNQIGVYGTKGVPDSGNSPGNRQDSISWVDQSGNLWLFGGNGITTPGGSTTGRFSDLWKYDVSSNQWTWVSGSNTANQAGVYGTKGTPATSNIPGARDSSVSWVDQSGNLWLFGGNGQATSSTVGRLNDLWKYNVSLNQWTWVSGSNSINQAGTYGSKGIPAPANIPGSRTSAISWVDQSGNLWLFGGNGQIPPSTSVGRFNDLWKYDVSSNQWTWVSGQNSAVNLPGVYGNKGFTSSNNTPRNRLSAVSWIDQSGRLWLFGGSSGGTGSGNLNDLWRYNP